MKRIFCTVLILNFLLPLVAQQTKTWNEAGRKFLIENLAQTRDEVIRETKNLSPAQWNFKESPDRWSINQIVEHLGIWELLLEREISQALVAGKRPELNDEKVTDSSVIAGLMEEKQHIVSGTFYFWLHQKQRVPGAFNGLIKNIFFAKQSLVAFYYLLFI